MAEMLSYAPDLRSITGGQGEYTMEFLRYEEVPGAPRQQGRRRGPGRGGGGQGVARARGSRRVGARSRVRSTREHQGHPHLDDDTVCDVCGRTLLRGERAETYLHGGARRSVCELCNVAGAARGLDPRGRRARVRRRAIARRPPALAVRPPARPRRETPRAAPATPRRADDVRRRPMRGRARRARGRAAPPPAPAAPRAPPPRAASVPREPAPRARGADQRRAARSPRAVELFNASEHTRTVAGVARSLGAARRVGAPARTPRPSVVNVVVSWELCWYRYEVDLSDEVRRCAPAEPGLRAGRARRRGAPANAAADERGALHAGG